MELFQIAGELTRHLKSLHSSGRSIGFVPTMGALHEGHISLVRTCKLQNDITVTSIFVNPNQFNNSKDLERYPRMPERDSEMLAAAGCDILFMPDVLQVYPEPDKRVFDFGGLDQTMEGLHRPGHFNGVAQVVTRLFDMVQPDRAYFGIKDFQQLAIIKKVVKDNSYPVQIVSCPIVREPDGLAMSSRNMLLGTEQRIQALALFHALKTGREMIGKFPPEEVKIKVLKLLDQSPGLRTEYFEIIDGDSLLPVHNWEKGRNTRGCLAAVVGETRLIDNMDYSL